jgi:hypothetical protein
MQNRIALTIIDPTEIPKTANNFIWLDSDNANVNLTGTDIDSFKNKAITENLLCTTADGITVRIPTHVDNDAEFNNEDSSLMDSTVGVAIGASAAVYEANTPFLYRDFTFFFVLRYNTSDIGLGRDIINAVQLQNLEYQALALTTSGIAYYYIDQFEGFQKGITAHPNAGWNKLIIAGNSRKLWINNELKFDLNDSWPQTSSLQPRDDLANQIFNIGVSSHNGSNYDGEFAESLHYGYTLEDYQVRGVTNYLNDKYNIF